MSKQLIIFTFIWALFVQAVLPSNAQEGFVKFVGKKNLKILLEVAATDEERQKGLMNRPELAKDRGMVFVFRPAQQVTFWMKDTLISLDMIFISKGKIVKIVKNAVPNQTSTLYPSMYPVTEVIEVNGGFSNSNMIKVGDRVVFKDIPQIEYSVQSMNK